MLMVSGVVIVAQNRLQSGASWLGSGNGAGGN